MDLEEAKNILSAQFFTYADFLYKTVEDLNLNKSAKILDIGTGFGTMSIILALQDYKVITGEPEGHHWSNWRDAARKVSVEDLITFKPFRAEKLPFERNIFDAVFCYTSLHHIDDKQLAMTEFNRVTKNTGVIIIFELTPKGVKRIQEFLPSHPEAINPIDFSQDLPLELEIKRTEYINAYKYKKKS